MSRSMLVSGLLGLALTACTPPPDLVDEDTDVTGDELADMSLSDVLPLFFREFEAEPSRLADLVGVLERELGEQGVDVTGPKDQREFSIVPLDFNDEALDVTHPTDPDPANQSAVVVFRQSRHDFDTNVSVMLEKNQVCIESNSTRYYDRTYTTDQACFEGGTCDTLRSTNEVLKELSILAAGWYDLPKDFRRFELSDGREVAIARSWTEKVYEGHGGGTFRQTFTAELWVENSAGTVDRTYAIWPEIDVGLGPDAMRDLISNSLEEGMIRPDDFADADSPEDIAAYCGEPRDRANTRAEDTAE